MLDVCKANQTVTSHQDDHAFPPGIAHHALSYFERERESDGAV